MIFGYNTNGLAHHRLDEALNLLVAEGYGGVALTLDVGPLDPLRSDAVAWKEWGRALRDRGLRCVVETGGRFLLDPRRKHWPNLCSRRDRDASRRVEYYARACQCASALGASVVSLWSGTPDEESERAFDLLLRRLPRVLEAAANEGVRVAFEPEPGMLIDDLASYRKLRAALDCPELGTTIDVGHLLVTESGSAQDHLAEFADSLINVHLDDARPGVHEHLPFGQGALDLGAVLASLRTMDYQGMASVELSRDAHRGADAVRESMQALREAGAQ